MLAPKVGGAKRKAGGAKRKAGQLQKTKNISKTKRRRLTHGIFK